MFNHFQAEAEADAQEEHVLAQILHDFRIKGDADNTCPLDGGHDDGKDDSGYNGRRDCILAQKRRMCNDSTACKDYNGREAQGGQILKLERCHSAVGSRSICTKVA